MSYKIDPLGRIEGHMAVEFEAPGVVTDEVSPTGGFVTDAKCEAQMFRGFENIMLDRQPQEGIQITQRI